MRLVIKLGMRHPANGDRGFWNLGALAGNRIRQRVALFAGLLPQQTFCFFDPLGEVFLISHHKVMDCFGVLMGDGLGESSIEYQGMATGAMFRIGGSAGAYPVAIRTHQLHGTVGASQIALQMDLVAQLDGSWIGRVSRPHCSEVRMSAVE